MALNAVVLPAPFGPMRLVIVPACTRNEIPASATFSEDAGKVSGMFGGPMGDVPVSGTLEGHALKVTMTAQTPQGPMTVVLTGDIDGDTIANGKADVAGMGQMEWTAKRTKQ